MKRLGHFNQDDQFHLFYTRQSMFPDMKPNTAYDIYIPNFQPFHHSSILPMCLNLGLWVPQTLVFQNILYESLGIPSDFESFSILLIFILFYFITLFVSTSDHDLGDWGYRYIYLITASPALSMIMTNK